MQRPHLLYLNFGSQNRDGRSMKTYEHQQETLLSPSNKTARLTNITIFNCIMCRLKLLVIWRRSCPNLKWLGKYGRYRKAPAEIRIHGTFCATDEEVSRVYVVGFLSGPISNMLRLRVHSTLWSNSWSLCNPCVVCLSASSALYEPSFLLCGCLE